MEKEKGITMLDVLQDEEDLEQDANVSHSFIVISSTSLSKSYHPHPQPYPCSHTYFYHKSDFIPL